MSGTTPIKTVTAASVLAMLLLSGCAGEGPNSAQAGGPQSL